MRAAVLGLLAMLLIPAAFVPTALGSPAERYLVSFHGEAPEDGARLLSGAHVLASFPFARVALVEGTPDAFRALRLLPEVAGIYPEERLSLNLEQARVVANGERPLGAPGWPTGRNVTVALVDSGIDAAHPAFEGRILANIRVTKGGATPSADGDSDGHGTHVAGIVAGDGAGSLDARHRGFAPEARLVGVDISDSFTTTSAVRAFAWIHENRHVHNIRVVSNSWGREKADAHYDPNDPVIRASDALVADGIVVVFSAGNRGRDGEATLTTEAMNPNVLTVGAASAAGRVEGYSSKGPARDGDGQSLPWVKPDIMATGSSITSTRTAAQAEPGATGEARYYTTMNGTSMAAPQVAAAAALLLDERPDLAPSMVAAILTASARDLGATGPDAQTGYGMLDVRGALDMAAALEEGERLVTVESRIPVRMDGTVAAAATQVLVVAGAPKLPPAEAVTLPLVLPEGSAEVSLWFNWTGTGEFAVVLTGPGGERVFRPAGEGSLRLETSVEPGTWRVEARSTGVAAYTPYELEGDILVRHQKMLEAPAELHARASYVPQGGFYVPQDSGARLLGIVGAAPGLILALAGVAATAAGLAWGRR